MPTGMQEYLYFPPWRDVGVGPYKKLFIFMNFNELRNFKGMNEQ